MTNQNFSVTRRKFLTTAATAALAAPLILESCAPKEMLRHACIGVGGMGFGDLKQFIKHSKVQIVAICDVDSERLKTASELVPDARTYTDWRELLKKEADNIDSINLAVPDHNHFAIAYSATKLGKHVYCQKPMCHDVSEVRLLTEASVKAGIKTQLGTQHASSENDRRAVKLIRDGAIGKIKHVYLCSNRPGIEAYRLEGPRPAETHEAPAYLNWDLWIGSAPMRSFAPGIYHKMKWRAWLDFGTGWSGDIGCHIFDAVWKGLDLKAPKSVVAEVQKSWQDSPERRADTWPQSNHISWIFPGNDQTESDELPIEWFDGEFYIPQEISSLYKGDIYPPESAMLIGTEGALLVQHGGGLTLLPQSKFKNHRIPGFSERNHYHHFVDACLGGENTESHFAQSGPMTEAILLGTVAIRVPGEKLEWDNINMKFPNYPDADKYISRIYRDGWSVAKF
ncbi:MAG: Gfo/Idh/MocA family oxidoreductase [Bacteroidetes bacterium]|nr:Gfo/Idh/MocA family oxidoreductase [Bacteroidota bacterium]